MTAQWQHRYISEVGEVILSERTPFVPEKYGISPQGGFTTQCHRGYVCEFMIQGQCCVLNRLLIRMRPLLMYQGKVPIEEYPLLNGKQPRTFFLTSNSWIALYDDIKLEFEFDTSLKSSFELPKGIPAEERKFRKVQSLYRYSVENPFERKIRERTSQDSKRVKDYKNPLTDLSVNNSTRKRSENMQPMVNFRGHLAMGYDIIGDIHGHADELESLLDKVGYSSDGRRHPKRRRLIFLGDFIDFGQKNRRVVEIIRALIRADLAFAVMGNHEYNAICYHSTGKGDVTQHLREHNEKNRIQHQAFLNEYPDMEERSRVIQWFQRLPLFLDLGDLRIVHACWDQEAVDFVGTQYGNQLTNEFLYRSVDCNRQEHSVIETLLKGPERSLRPGLSFSDSYGTVRTHFRLKWWKEELHTLGDAAILPQGTLIECLDEALVRHCGDQPVSNYPFDAPPVFFGHYSALPIEESFTRNTACLDYSIIEGRNLACLRWNKEDKGNSPSEMQIVTVPAKKIITPKKEFEVEL